MKIFLWDGAERLDPESSQISGSNLNKMRIYMIVMHMYAGLEIRIFIAGPSYSAMQFYYFYLHFRSILRKLILFFHFRVVFLYSPPLKND